jgi:hypothetical protein
MKKIIPLFDATVPVACTIDPGEVADRIEVVERMRSNLTRLERTEYGMLLTFPNRLDVDADVQQFAVDEKRCCQFWGFAVTAHADELSLQWDGPPDARELIDRIHRFFEGDESASFLEGLL